jgi:coenzyme F420-reducing hydrogenase alpha subunit
MHHYKIDEKGLITWANMIIATGQQQPGNEQGRFAGGPPIHPRDQN